MTTLNVRKKGLRQWAGVAALAVASTGVLADGPWAWAPTAKAFCDKSPQPCGWVAENSDEWNATFESEEVSGGYEPNFYGSWWVDKDGDIGNQTTMERHKTSYSYPRRPSNPTFLA